MIPVRGGHKVIAHGAVAQGVAALVLCGCAAAPPPILPPPGYLPADAAPAFVHPSPQAISDSLPMTDDRRWLAIAHAELRPAFAPAHFDCALGFRLSGRDAPATRRLFARLGRDITSRLQRAAAEEASLGQPCIRTRFLSADSGSGRAAALGAAYAGALALLAPDRADALTAAGAAIGDSARLCGLADADQTVAGAALGLAVLQSASATADFADDLNSARAEVEAARASALTSPACAAERRALAVN